MISWNVFTNWSSMLFFYLISSLCFSCLNNQKFQFANSPFRHVAPQRQASLHHGKNFKSKLSVVCAPVAHMSHKTCHMLTNASACFPHSRTHQLYIWFFQMRTAYQTNNNLFEWSSCRFTYSCRVMTLSVSGQYHLQSFRNIKEK